MRRFLGVILVLALIFPCFAQQQQQQQRKGNSGEGGNRSSFIETLDLTPSQREAFIELRKNFRGGDSINFANLNKLRSELIDESAKEVIDSAKISRIASQIAEQHFALSIKLSENIKKVKEILNQEQFERFIEHRKSRIVRNFKQNRGESKQNQ